MSKLRGTFALIGLLVILLGCEDRPAGDPEACLNQMDSLVRTQDHAAAIGKYLAELEDYHQVIPFDPSSGELIRLETWLVEKGGK